MIVIVTRTAIATTIVTVTAIVTVIAIATTTETATMKKTLEYNIIMLAHSREQPGSQVLKLALSKCKAMGRCHPSNPI